MPSFHGGTDEETLEKLDENMIVNGSFDDRSDAIEYCIKYTLYNRYNEDV